MGLEAVLSEVARNPSAVGLFSDFDGTLARIVPDPATVVPVEGAVDRLDELSTLLGRVAVVSGRPVEFLHGFFAADVELSGLYGIEHWEGGRFLVDHAAIEWLPTVRGAVDAAIAEFGESVVEDKTYSLTLHYRHAEDGDLAVRLRAWADDHASTAGLEVRVARMSIELHPPIGLSKADALDTMLAGLTSAIYFGDDIGDGPALAHLGELVDGGRLDAGASVLVSSDETPSELRALATDIVEGPDGVVRTLERILAVARGARDEPSG